MSALAAGTRARPRITVRGTVRILHQHGNRERSLAILVRLEVLLRLAAYGNRGILMLGVAIILEDLCADLLAVKA